MKGIGRIIRNCVFILMAGGILGTLLLMLAFCMPVKEANRDLSVSVTDVEGPYPLANLLTSQGAGNFANYLPQILDNATDKVILQTVFDESGGSIAARAMSMRDYPIYWHGYVALLRPLFYFINYMDFRVVNGILQLILAFAMAGAVWRATGRGGYVAAFATSYILLMPCALALSLQYSWVYYIAMGGSLLMVKKSDFFRGRSRYIYCFLILGMLTSYFDLLTYPLVSWGFPLIWWLAAGPGKENGMQRLRFIVCSGLGWIGGYGGFWLLKWAIATPILGQNVIKLAFDEIFYRVGEVDQYAQEILGVYGRCDALYVNWRHYEYALYGVLILAWISWIVFQDVKAGGQRKAAAWPLLPVICAGPLWYFVLSNHTGIHHFFTYRIYGVSILAFLVFWLEYFEKRQDRAAGGKLRKQISAAAVWGICAILGLGAAAAAAKEDIHVNSGEGAGEIVLNGGDTLEMSFIPTCSNLRKIGFYMNNYSGSSSYQIIVRDGGSILYQIEVPLDGSNEIICAGAGVDWDFKSLKEYRLQVKGSENAKLGFVLAGEPESGGPLHEYRDLTFNGEPMEGQLVSDLTYHARVASKPRLIYLAVVVAAFLRTLAAGIWPSGKIAS